MITINNEDFDIEKIADSGQCFRMNKEDDHYLCIAGDKVLRVYGNKLDCSKKEYDSFWKNYFDLNTDYSVFRNAIPKNDKYLRNAASFGKGIRILRQDPWEMLISFIISQRKSIPAIKTSIESICKLCGNAIAGERSLKSFPTAKSLAKLTEDELKTCSLGYRASYVKAAAELVSSGRIDLEALNCLSDEDLMAELVKLYGVGVKVANCVSLFGYHRIGAFPIDVWIARVLEEEYPKGFPFKRYDGFAGVIQQYMFYAARMSNKKTKL